MIDTIQTDLLFDQAFLTDVLNGLQQHPKTLSSKYFYDEIGDKLFQQIMDLEEYYLTNAELDIFLNQKEQILNLFSPDRAPFNLVEFGAGDGTKTKILLDHFINRSANFEYIPIDISSHALEGLENNLRTELPKLKINPMQGDYFEVLDELSHSSSRRNIILFLGSNIGNFTSEETNAFLKKIRSDINTGDLLLIGIDLKKNPDQILAAYNDREGITEAFNLNLLDRINRELDANFDTAKFRHYPIYNPHTGECKSNLISTENQVVDIAGEAIEFQKWESIQTEISKKYDQREIKELAHNCGFQIERQLLDSQGYFVDSIWRAV